MKKARLIDKVEGKTHNLFGLVLEYGPELIIGRYEGNDIVLSPEIKKTSRVHALIFYLPRDNHDGDFYIKDKSLNGTMVLRNNIREYIRNGEIFKLQHRDEIWFGPDYGPVIYEEYN
jgi:pSer/pThr/pTyr-binding forkhead associated (FHA) protein